MAILKPLLICGFLVGTSNFAVAADDVLSAGPLFDSFPLALAPGHRTELLGPLFYSEEREDSQRTWAIPPLISHLEAAETDSEEWDFLYPLITFDRYGSEYRWQLGQLLSFAGGQTLQEEDTHRFTLFPLYFQQRSENPDRNYTAVVPFYGRLRGRLFRDEIFFILFPIYGHSRKRDVITHNYLYPFFHVRHGNELEGWQFWPLIGREHKGVTTRTNGFGETEIIGGHEKLFVLWPIFFDQSSGIGTANPQRQQAALPVYSYTRSPQRDSTSVVWPFFNYIVEREKKYTEWQLPWPLVIFARGEGKTTSRVWPLFSQAQSSNLQSDAYLWPIYKYNRFHSEAVERERTRILLFLYSDTIQKNLSTGAHRRRVDFWPLFTHRREYDGSTRLQLLSILEPLLPEHRSIERNYSHLWSLWRSEKNAKTGAASQSLLWNLYRRDVTANSKKCSLLFGLFQYQSGSEGKRVRLLYIPVVKTRPAATPARVE